MRTRKIFNQNQRMIKKITLFKDALMASTIIFFGLCLIFVFFAWMEEYQVLVAGSTSDSVTISVEVAAGISINSPSDETLTPEIVETGSATGDVTWTVSTNNSDGWKLELEASSSPALNDGDSHTFADYTEAVAGTPETWSVASDASEFGFSAAGTYAESEYSSGTLFEGFEGSSKIQVAHQNSASPGGGAEVQVNFQAEVGSSKSQESGTYTATITATATTL